MLPPPLMPLMWISHADKHTQQVCLTARVCLPAQIIFNKNHQLTRKRKNLPEPIRKSCKELVWMVVQMLHEEQVIQIKFYLRLLYLILQKILLRPRVALVQQLVDVHQSGTTQRNIRNGQHTT